jgi:signal transduction histidine kinase
MEKYTDKEVTLSGQQSAGNKKDSALRQLMKTLEAVNDKLKESESLKTHFLSNIRNEINNPLNSIMGLSEHIIQGLHKDPCMIENIAKTIYSEAFALDFQLRNIFTAAELEAGEYTLSISHVDIDALMKSTICSFKHKADQKGIEIVYSWQSISESDKNAFFLTDPEKIKLILSNLLNNAIEFSADQSTIEFKAKRDGKNLYFSLRDYGIGFHMDDQMIIFERFRQLDTGVRRRHRGHGLGLSIAKDLIEIFGGTISVISEERKGTEFVVFVPESRQTEETEVYSDDGNIFIF